MEIAYSFIDNSIIGSEIWKMKNFNKFENYIDLITFSHLKNASTITANCKFIDSVINIYIAN